MTVVLLSRFLFTCCILPRWPGILPRLRFRRKAQLLRHFETVFWLALTIFGGAYSSVLSILLAEEHSSVWTPFHDFPSLLKAVTSGRCRFVINQLFHYEECLLGKTLCPQAPANHFQREVKVSRDAGLRNEQGVET